MKDKHEFVIGEIANDFRHSFSTRLSDKARGKWASVDVNFSTNAEQNALYFEHKITWNDGDRLIYDDIKDVLKTLKELYCFKIVSLSPESCEITNISWAKGGQDAI